MASSYLHVVEIDTNDRKGIRYAYPSLQDAEDLIVTLMMRPDIKTVNYYRVMHLETKSAYDILRYWKRD